MCVCYVMSLSRTGNFRPQNLPSEGYRCDLVCCNGTRGGDEDEEREKRRCVEFQRSLPLVILRHKLSVLCCR